MNKIEIFSVVKEIFIEVFDNEELFITESTNSRDIDDWDSLEHINLIVAMEMRFRIKFSLAEVTELKNVGEMVDLIERKLRVNE